jgi:hypothetical protein
VSLIGIDSFLQKPLIIILKKPTVQTGDAFKNTAHKPGVEIVKF